MIEYQYYSNHRDYHESFNESHLQYQLTDDNNINSILISYNNDSNYSNNQNYNKILNSYSNTNNNVKVKSTSSSDLINYNNNTYDQLLTDTLLSDNDKIKSASSSDLITYNNTNYDQLLTDTLLTDNEIDFIKEIFDDTSSITSQSNLSISDHSSVDNRNIKNKNKSEVNHIVFTYNENQQRRSLQIMKRNFHEFQQSLYACVLSISLEELSRKVYQILHPKCLVRFKLSNISAKSGPKSLVDYFNLIKKAFPDGQKSFTKDKFLIADGYHIYKRKFVFCGTESSFEDSFNFFSYCSNIKDILYLKNRKDNFTPNKYCIKINVTRYVDPSTYQVVLCDIGLDIVSQKSIQ